MLRHIVLWRLQGASPADKRPVALEIKSRLEALNGRVPGLILLQVGIDFSESPESADVVLYSEFESRQALEAYQVHPEHVAVMPYIKSVRTERRVVDYESD